MLDTDTCVYAMKDRVARFERVSPLDCGISSVVLGELLYGCHRSNRIAHNLKVTQAFIELVTVVHVDDDAANEYGRLRAHLARRGEIIGANDLWIGAQAKALGCTLVTNNQKEFKRVPGLKLANWLDA